MEVDPNLERDRAIHEEFKRRIKAQTVLPCAETAAMLFWALLASGQITMRKVDGWQTPPRNQTIRSLTSPHDRIASCRPKMRQSIPTQVATGPRAESQGFCRASARLQSLLLFSGS